MILVPSEADPWPGPDEEIETDVFDDGPHRAPQDELEAVFVDNWFHAPSLRLNGTSYYARVLGTTVEYSRFADFRVIEARVMPVASDPIWLSEDEQEKGPQDYHPRGDKPKPRNTGPRPKNPFAHRGKRRF